jgi:endonuclease G
MSKHKYHLFILLVLAGSLYMAGCSEKDDMPAPAPALEATLNGSADFKWNTPGRFLTITTAEAWTVTPTYPEGAPEGWCTASVGSGTGNKNVWIATAANTGEIRQVTITVSTATERAEIVIVQYSTAEPPPDADTPAEVAGRFELPKVENERWLLAYAPGEFTMEYDTVKKHSKWVAWQLYKSHMGSSGRTDAWQFDPRIPSEFSPVRGSGSENNDFSGYDRGHLCPSADRTQSKAMNAQTFMYSNMSPQIAAFNQGIWGVLEERIRTWASGQDTLYICAGGTVLKESDIMTYTTPSHMAVPKYYFKVILRKKAVTGAFDAIGFWFENRSYSGTPLSSAQVKKIDDIEALTGIDFFHLLPEEIQTRVEAALTPSAWGL